MVRGDEPPAAAPTTMNPMYHNAMPGHQPWGLNGDNYTQRNGGYAPAFADPASAWLSRPTQPPQDLFSFASWPIERPQPRTVAYPDENADQYDPVRSSDVGSSVVVHTAVGATLSRTSKQAIAPFIVARPEQPQQQQLRYDYPGANNGMHLR
jgi:hypothetical protein